jgi:hypothetical protein
MRWDGLDSYNTQYKPEMHSRELLGSKKCWGILEQLKNRRLLKKDSAPSRELLKTRTKRQDLETGAINVLENVWIQMVEEQHERVLTDIYTDAKVKNLTN